LAKSFFPKQKRLGESRSAFYSMYTIHLMTRSAGKQLEANRSDIKTPSQYNEIQYPSAQTARKN
jgi:hypothetical protein